MNKTLGIVTWHEKRRPSTGKWLWNGMTVRGGGGGKSKVILEIETL